ncbi:MAG: DUF503 domain-containing protein [Candidatus Eremiobacterota bacterium]
MYICKCWFDIHLLEEPNSLKRKRQILKSLKDRIWNKFRVSIAEVGEYDLWQKAELGIAFVSSDGTLIEQMFAKILNLIDTDDEVEIVDMFHDIEKMK